MLHSIHKFVRASGRRLLTLALLPAFFVASLPHRACMCADGHRTAACRMLRMTAASSVAKQTSGKSCCQKRIEKEERVCCAVHRNLPGGHGVTAIKSKASSCCRVVVELPAAVTSSEQSDAKKVVQSSAIAEPFVQLFGIGAPQTTFANSIQPPPPIDTVILYSRLTI